MKLQRHQTSVADRRDFPRLSGSFKVRFGICGALGREVPGFTNNLSLGGISFVSPATQAKLGDQIAVEIAVPGFEDPLYFLGQVVRVHDEAGGTEIGCRFDWLGKSDSYREKLKAFLGAHAGAVVE